MFSLIKNYFLSFIGIRTSDRENRKRNRDPCCDEYSAPKVKVRRQQTVGPDMASGQIPVQQPNCGPIGQMSQESTEASSECTENMTVSSRNSCFSAAISRASSEISLLSGNSTKSSTKNHLVDISQEDDDIIEITEGSEEASSGKWVPARPMRVATRRSKQEPSLPSMVSRSTSMEDIEFIKEVPSGLALAKERGDVYFATPSTSLEVGAGKKKLVIKESISKREPSSQMKLEVNKNFNSNFRILSSISVRGTPSHITLNQSFNLDEKQRYSLLLKKFCQKLEKSKNPESPPCRTYRNLSETSKQSLRNAKSEVELVDISSSPSSSPRTSVRRNVVPKPASSRTRDSPKKNSLEAKMRENPIYNLNWSDEMVQKYKANEREKKKAIGDEKLRKELYSAHNEETYINTIHERLQNHLRVTEVILPDEEVLEVTKLPDITTEMDIDIKKALVPSPAGQVLVEKFGLRITRHDMATLSGINWLNDEVINFYMNLLIERGKEDKYPSIYAYNTFMYTKLMNGGHGVLKRWTKKIDIFSYDLLIVPVHLGVHWCLSVIDLINKTVKYYDSMGGNNMSCIKALLKYLQDEHMDKKKKALSVKDWNTEIVKDIPQQMNGSDCGMFSCMYAEYICRNAPITFTQNEMPYMRRKMVYEILNCKLLL